MRKRLALLVLFLAVTATAAVARPAAAFVCPVDNCPARSVRFCCPTYSFCCPFNARCVCLPL